MKKLEVLAPAGDYSILKAAVAAGADAVYVGGQKFGARAFANNLSTEELKEAIDHVHLHGRKLYLTVNTLVKEREFYELYDYLAPLYEQGLDAVIVQDFGVLSFLRNQFPDLGVHASTQMTVTHPAFGKELKDAGVSRIVPARELSLSEIKELYDETGLEIESFVHGALCYSYSGQCLMSSMIGGRSGNRGQCAQPCRLPYSVGGRKPFDLMSLKDLCALNLIPELAEAGVYSFKIEGRMKQMPYVQTVTSMYRKYTDLYLEHGRDGFKVEEADLAALTSAYRRRGYCDGYYHRHNGKSMISVSRPEENAKDLPVKDEVITGKCKEKINGKLMLSKDAYDTLYLSCGKTQILVSADISEEARSAPTGTERIRKQIEKTGDTPFEFENLVITGDRDLFLPVGKLNDLRRQGLAELEKKIVSEFRRPQRGNLYSKAGKEDQVGSSSSENWLPKLTASVETFDQLKALTRFPELTRIYVEDTMLADGSDMDLCRELIRLFHDKETEVWFGTTRIFRKEAKDWYERSLDDLLDLFDGALVRNMEGFLYLRGRRPDYPVICDSSVYVWNREAKQFVLSYKPGMLSAPYELSARELKDLDISDMELTAYGRIPAMISAGCVKKNTGRCDHRTEVITITDRLGHSLPVHCICRYCMNVIYNTVPVNLLGRSKEINVLCPAAIRNAYTLETAEEVREITEDYIRCFLKGEPAEIPSGEYTNRHFTKGVK